MADVFWNYATPAVAAGDVPKSFVPVRVAGAAADGTQDQFKQAPIGQFAAAADVATIVATTLYAALPPFNIKGDGTDQTVAMQTLATYLAGLTAPAKVVLPFGVILISSDIVFSGRFTILNGVFNGTVIRVANNARILIQPGDLDELVGPGILIEGITFQVKGGIHTDAPLRVTLGNYSNGSTWQPVILRDLVVEGVTYTDGWSIGIGLTNCTNGIFENLRGFGDRGHTAAYGGAGAQSGTFIVHTTSGDPTLASGGAASACKYDQINAYWCDRLVTLSGHHEGPIFTRLQCVGLRAGIYWVAPTTGNPLLVVRDSFLNCSTICIYAKNLVQVDITGNAFYPQSAGDITAPSAWQGVVIENGAGYNMLSQITDNMFLMLSAAAANVVAIHVIGSPDGTGSTSVIIRNRYQGGNIGVQLDSGTSKVLVSNDNMFYGVPNPVVNSAGSANKIGDYYAF